MYTQMLTGVLSVIMKKSGNKPNVPQENKLCNIHAMGHNVTSKNQLWFTVLNVPTWF